MAAGGGNAPTAPGGLDRQRTQSPFRAGGGTANSWPGERAREGPLRRLSQGGRHLGGELRHRRRVVDRRGDSAYTYLPASVRRFPGPEELADLLRQSGFAQVRWDMLGGGIVALHVAEMPAADSPNP